MVSALDKAKRALVAVLLHLATAYGARLTVTRDSSAPEVNRAEGGDAGEDFFLGAQRRYESSFEKRRN